MSKYDPTVAKRMIEETRHALHPEPTDAEREEWGKAQVELFEELTKLDGYDQIKVSKERNTELGFDYLKFWYAGQHDHAHILLKPNRIVAGEFTITREPARAGDDKSQLETRVRLLYNCDTNRFEWPEGMDAGVDALTSRRDGFTMLMSIVLKRLVKETRG